MTDSPKLNSVIIFAVVFVLFKVFRELGKRKAKTLSPRYDGKNIDVEMGNVNGCGMDMCGLFLHFRRHNLSPEHSQFHKNESIVVYRCLTFIFIPIVPVGCYRINIWVEREQRSSKRTISRYQIYGTERWIFWEVLSIYCLSGLVLSGIYCISTVFDLGLW